MEFEQRLTDYGAALSWVADRMGSVAPAELDLPTPCEEFTVRALTGHLLGTAYRALGTASGESTRHVPHVVTDVRDEELAPTYAALAASVTARWHEFRDGNRLVVAPWGECSARRAVEGFTIETLVHGWDLAMATGHDPDELSAVGERCLGYAPDVIPARLRGVMYDDPVRSRAQDGATTRLARLLGRG